jgi:hypothetical protein
MQQRWMANIFNEWARRYAENPNEFGAIVDEHGKPVEGYGQRCAIYFFKISDDMEEKRLPQISGKVPKLKPWPAAPDADT